MKTTKVWIALAALAGCAQTGPAAQPLSAEEHLERAASLERAAALEQRAYDPSKERATFPPIIDQQSPIDVYSRYNPTEWHRRRARKLERRAREHEAAAAALLRRDAATSSVQ